MKARRLAHAARTPLGGELTYGRCLRDESSTRVQPSPATTSTVKIDTTQLCFIITAFVSINIASCYYICGATDPDAEAGQTSAVAVVPETRMLTSRLYEESA